MKDSITLATPNSGSPFDSIRHLDENGQEYWLARELASMLGYVRWQMFDRSIEQAKENLELTGSIVSDHFLLLKVKSTTKPQLDYKLTRFACYHLVLACNGKGKPLVAQAKQYFVSKARQAEISQQLSPAQLLIAQGQAMLAIEKEQARLQAKQAELEAKLVFEAQRTDELEQLVHQYDGEIDRIFNPNGHYFSVMGYARNRGLKMPLDLAKEIGRKCSKYCRDNDILVSKLNDPRWGSIGSYPEDVIAIFA